MGILKGDRIVSIEGREVSTPKGFVETIRAHSRDADGVQIRLSRDGAPLDVTVMPKDGKI